jgi:hypothetical protein
MKRLKLKLSDVTTPGFVEALEKLGQEQLSTREKYAIARSRRDVVSHLETYNSERLKVIKQLGRPKEQILQAALDQMRGMESSGTIERQMKNVKDELAFIEANKVKSWMIDENDQQAMEQFKAALTELRAVEFEIFLDHQIALPDPCGLSSGEIEALMPLIAEPLDEPAVIILPPPQPK